MIICVRKRFIPYACACWNESGKQSNNNTPVVGNIYFYVQDLCGTIARFIVCEGRDLILLFLHHFKY